MQSRSSRVLVTGRSRSGCRDPEQPPPRTTSDTAVPSEQNNFTQNFSLSISVHSEFLKPLQGQTGRSKCTLFSSFDMLQMCTLVGLTVCMCVCVCVCVRSCVHACVHKSVCVYVCLSVCLSVCEIKCISLFFFF